MFEPAPSSKGPSGSSTSGTPVIVGRSNTCLTICGRIPRAATGSSRTYPSSATPSISKTARKECGRRDEVFDQTTSSGTPSRRVREPPSSSRTHDTRRFRFCRLQRRTRLGPYRKVLIGAAPNEKAKRQKGRNGDGETFSEPIDITAALEEFREDYPWQVIAPGHGHGIRLRNGRLLARLDQLNL